MAQGLRGQMLARIATVAAGVSAALVVLAGAALVGHEYANEASYEVDAVERVVSSLEGRELAREEADELLTADYLNRLHVAAYMLDEAAAKTGSTEVTDELCSRIAEAIEVDAFHVIGPDGTVLASSVPQSTGVSFYEHEELSEFLPLIEGREPSGHHVELNGTSLALGEEQTFVGMRDGDLTLQVEVSPWRTAGYRDIYSVSSYFASLPDPDYRIYFALDALDGDVLAVSGNDGRGLEVPDALNELGRCEGSPRVAWVNGAPQLVYVQRHGSMLVGCATTLASVLSDVVPYLAGVAASLLVVALFVVASLYRLIDRVVLRDVDAVVSGVERFVGGGARIAVPEPRSAELAELEENLDKLVDVVGHTGMRLSHIVNGMGGSIEGFEYFDALNRAYYSRGLLALVELDDEEFRARMREAVREVGERDLGTEVERSMTFLRADGRALEVHVLLSPTFAYGLVEDVSDRVRHEHELEERAERAEERGSHDELTGLSNRGGLIAAVEAELRGRRRGTLFLMDLDNFKLVNDSAGHREGDAVLREFAVLLGQSFRGDDVKARLGGDEFAVFVPGVSDSRAVVERASAFLASSHRALSRHRARFSLSVSMGAASLGPSCRDFETLYEMADAAMYEAKRGGKDGFCLAGEGPAPGVRAAAPALGALPAPSVPDERHEELLRSLERREFRAWFQSKCDVATGRIVGAEALARWHRADGTMAVPGEFVVRLEWEGLSRALDLAILRDVCEALVSWGWDGAVPVSFNMSRASLSDESIVDEVREVIESTGASASWLEVEVTEDMPTESEERLDRALEGLRDLGLSIALDDFGAGYSSLASVGAHRFDVLKLDASLVREIGTRRGEKIVSMVVFLAHELGMSVVAEGVESERQLEFLATCDCEVAQGFYFGGPLPRPAFEGVVRRTALEGALGSRRPEGA